MNLQLKYIVLRTPGRDGQSHSKKEQTPDAQFKVPKPGVNEVSLKKTHPR